MLILLKVHFDLPWKMQPIKNEYYEDSTKQDKNLEHYIELYNPHQLLQLQCLQVMHHDTFQCANKYVLAYEQDALPQELVFLTDQQGLQPYLDLKKPPPHECINVSQEDDLDFFDKNIIKKDQTPTNINTKNQFKEHYSKIIDNKKRYADNIGVDFHLHENDKDFK